MTIPVYKPNCTQDDIDSVIKILKSDYWGCGKETKQFEQEFSDLINVKHSIATNSCTAALIIAGKILDLDEHSEVLIPAITWISTAYLAKHHGYKINFVDVKPDTLTIDPIDLANKINKNTKAVVIMHHAGNPCDMEAIMKIITDNNLVLIEDCAHSVGSTYNGRMLGSFGHLACFSFQAVKTIATGDGGMLVTNDDLSAERARVLRWLGMNIDSSQRMIGSKYSWQHDIVEVGYKYQMNDIIAALGRSQMRRLKSIINCRKALFRRYNILLRDYVNIPTMNNESSCHIYMIKHHNRDRLMEHLANHDVHSSVHYRPLYHYSIFSDIKHHCPNAESEWSKILTLPLYGSMTIPEQDRVIDAIISYKD